LADWPELIKKQSENKNGGTLVPPFLCIATITLKQGGSHDDQRQNNQNDGNLRGIHKAVIEIQMSLILLVKIVGVHVIKAPPPRLKSTIGYDVASS
jgi:hypothetical protein